MPPSARCRRQPTHTPREQAANIIGAHNAGIRRPRKHPGCRSTLRVAYLYRADLALPRRRATPAQLAALSKAMAARRTCPVCGTEKAYCIPRSTGLCNDCADGSYQ